MKTTTTIIAKCDLYNNGKCFTGGFPYEVNKVIHNTAALMDLIVINDLGEPHCISGWWREFEIQEED